MLKEGKGHNNCIELNTCQSQYLENDHQHQAEDTFFAMMYKGQGHIVFDFHSYLSINSLQT